MDTYRSEQEQVEALKEWWDKNGQSVLWGLVLVVAVVAGGRWWMGSQDAARAAASMQYEVMLEQMQRGNLEQAQQAGSAIIENHEDTPYGVLAALALARAALQQDDVDSAVLHLRWAHDHAEMGPVKELARLRLARALLAQGQAQEALQLAEAPAGEAYQGTFAALRGDIHTQLGNGDKARVAYRTALDDPETAGGMRQVLQMKLDNLPVVTASEGGEAS